MFWFLPCFPAHSLLFSGLSVFIVSFTFYWCIRKEEMEGKKWGRWFSRPRPCKRYKFIARGVGHPKRQERQLQLWVWQKKLSLINLTNKILAYLHKRANEKVANEAYSGCSITSDHILCLLARNLWIYLIFSFIFAIFHSQFDTGGVNGRTGRPVIYAPDNSDNT